MSRFKGNYFHFLPRTGKGRKTSKLPVSRGGRQASTWAVNRHVPSLPLLQPPLPHRCLTETELIRPRTNAFHSLSREEGACHGRINLDPPLVPALPAGSQSQLHTGAPTQLAPWSLSPGISKSETNVALDVPCRRRNLCPCEA